MDLDDDRAIRGHPGAVGDCWTRVIVKRRRRQEGERLGSCAVGGHSPLVQRPRPTSDGGADSSEANPACQARFPSRFRHPGSIRTSFADRTRRLPVWSRHRSFWSFLSSPRGSVHEDHAEIADSLKGGREFSSLPARTNAERGAERIGSRSMLSSFPLRGRDQRRIAPGPKPSLRIVRRRTGCSWGRSQCLAGRR